MRFETLSYIIVQSRTPAFPSIFKSFIVTTHECHDFKILTYKLWTDCKLNYFVDTQVVPKSLAQRWNEERAAVVEMDRGLVLAILKSRLSMQVCQCRDSEHNALYQLCLEVPCLGSTCWHWYRTGVSSSFVCIVLLNDEIYVLMTFKHIYNDSELRAVELTLFIAISCFVMVKQNPLILGLKDYSCFIYLDCHISCLVSYNQLNCTVLYNYPSIYLDINNIAPFQYLSKRYHSED